MNDKEIQLNAILVKIAEEISITNSMIDEAVSSYEAVGAHLGSGIEYSVHISPQGSMSLGTTIKPISDEDDYDIDLVCMLENGQQLNPKSIKNIVGKRLMEHKIYREKILEEGEGKRCWKMKYNAFHMDILPCVPKLYYSEPNLTDIRLTHKVSDDLYEDRYSNPFGYRKWFESRMTHSLDKEKRKYATYNKMNIEDVPTFRVKTPLQMSIQLLKRHRDILFQDDSENAPISIIITTLAAKAYDGEENVYNAIKTILNSMNKYIEIIDGVYWVQNPVMSQENFADKWQIYPERKEAFFKWLTKAKEDFILTPYKVSGLDDLSQQFKKSIGNAPVERAFKAYGDEFLKSRNDGKLFSKGLTAGLTTNLVNGATKVKGHNFYGK